MRAALPKVDVPVLLMHSKDEKYILPDNMEEIYQATGKYVRQDKIYMTGSGHVLPRDASREQVFTSALEFIQRVNPQK